MITEKELLEAIRTCEAEPITPSKVGKLADFYIIYDHLFGEPKESVTRQAEQVETIIEPNGDSEFLMAVYGRKSEKVWRIMDELMEAVKILHPKMYESVINKLYD